MLVVALVALLVPAVTVTAAAQIIRSLIRQQARERELLLNQVMHLSGKTWTPPPAERYEPPAPEPERDRFIAVPEQLPDDFDWSADT